ncbi:DGQHR domain-containing protein [Bradyrhizobium shewense]|uniref:DGQHR domain-containing protein n=1 Tax=Bradyrhizobium shewense TaxID=1761772 RepID=A0A1C3XIM8_9BRAD|nr:DGQHR domain-containing protein [Bradyrhizobium shewense]SCB52108.1 DGQHR domain-containing protein [Bradyrhizobium shewense]
MAKKAELRHVPAIKVRQWLRGWEKIEFDAGEHRRRPPPQFFLFSLPARELRSLSGIARRKSDGVTPRAADLGIQRQHEPERSEEIAKFVEYGFPWSTLSEAKRRSAEFNDLRKPGWLPTAIVINILGADDVRVAGKVAPKDLVSVASEGTICRVDLPYEEWTDSWRPSGTPPFEIIDGQHRLWAFDNADADFELPVVAFHGLDISWQAYLFWTINIKPKRINPSLAFDLYPLLRAEDWLDRAEGHPVYRETRSQELTEALWSHKDSPWYDRINMLGEKSNPWVSQSAWIKSLVATFIRPWGGKSSRLGGLFGSRMEEGQEVLGWSRAQQAAFLIFAWQQFKAAVKKSEGAWAKNLRVEAIKSKEPVPNDDPAFYSRYSLIVTDQGVRGFLHVLNDLCFIRASKLDLRSWQVARQAGANDTDAVTLAMTSLRKHRVASFVSEIAEALAEFDWRASSTPELPEKLRREKLVFRGSSGYKEIRTQLLETLRTGDGDVAETAKRL